MPMTPATRKSARSIDRSAVRLRLTRRRRDSRRWFKGFFVYRDSGPGFQQPTMFSEWPAGHVAVASLVRSCRHARSHERHLLSASMLAYHDDGTPICTLDPRWSSARACALILRCARDPDNYWHGVRRVVELDVVLRRDPRSGMVVT